MLAHEVDKLTTVLFSLLPQVPSTRPKKFVLSEGGWGGGLEFIWKLDSSIVQVFEDEFSHENIHTPE